VFTTTSTYNTPVETALFMLGSEQDPEECDATTAK